MKSSAFGGGGRSGGATASVVPLRGYAIADSPRAPTNAEETRSIVSELDALAARHPEHADLIWIVQFQVRLARRYPDSAPMREVLAASVARLGALISEQRENPR